MTEKVRAHVFVIGLVQGVSFRANTKERAYSLGLRGWVRNNGDGRIEVVLEGKRKKVKRMLKWLKKGPSLSRVDSLDIEWKEYKGEFKDFEIRYT